VTYERMSDEKSVTNLKFWGMLLTKYDGKDKFLRAIQNFARAGQYYVKQQDKDSELAKRLSLVQKALSLDRKAFRLCRWVDDPFQIMATLTTDEPAQLKLLNFLGKLNMMGFVIFDNALWVASNKVVLWNSAWIKSWAMFFRAWAALIQTIYALLKLRRIIDAFSKKGENEGKAITGNEKFQEATWDLYKVIFDVLTYVPAAGYDQKWFGIKMTDGAIGTAGGLSSLISLRKIFKKL